MARPVGNFRETESATVVDKMLFYDTNSTMVTDGPDTAVEKMLLYDTYSTTVTSKPADPSYSWSPVAT